MSQQWFTRLRSVLVVLGLIILGIVLALVFFEVAFRVGGAVYQAVTNSRNLSALNKDGTIRILCLGESTTQMGGESSYPRQLELRLNYLQDRVQYAVINGGIPGGNTTMIAAKLPAQIKQYRPDIVVMMMGINDVAAKVVGKGEALFKKTNPIIALLQKSRLVRLLNGLWIAQRSKTVSIDNAIETDKLVIAQPQDQSLLKYATISTAGLKYSQAVAAYQELIKRNQKYGSWPNCWFYRKIGWIYHKTGDHEKYLQTINAILELNTKDAWAKDQVVEMCRADKNDPAVVDFLRQAIHQQPDQASLYELLGNCFVSRGEDKPATEYLREAHRRRVAAVNPVTRENYRVILDLLDQQNIQTVIVQYPVRSFDELSVILEGIDKVDRAILVDNQKIFKSVLATGRYEDYFLDRFAGDFGHCTAKGNYLLADNIAKYILNAFKMN
jgi:tetratricopeptide (TPR) repeat protein